MKTTTIRLSLGAFILAIAIAISVPSITSCNTSEDVKDSSSVFVDTIPVVGVDSALVAIDSTKIDTTK
jgi:hypothetical protein